jgi:hypothetical protein
VDHLHTTDKPIVNQYPALCCVYGNNWPSFWVVAYTYQATYSGCT